MGPSIAPSRAVLVLAVLAGLLLGVGGFTDAQLQPALELQRKAQWRLDFIAAENSMGFHAPQEAAMVLGEALDYARQGELAAATWNSSLRAGSAASGAKPTPARGAKTP